MISKAIDLIPQWLIKDKENRLKICPNDAKLMRYIEDGFLIEIEKLKQEKEGNKNDNLYK